jgi:Kelch motif/Galactose oxidase, central domain
MKTQSRKYALVMLAFIALAFNLAIVPLALADGFFEDNPMNSCRGGHAATMIGSTGAEGQMLVAGGYDSSGNALAGAEVYTENDGYPPVTGGWANTGSMNTPRYFHTMTLLTNGEVLAVGGNNSSSTLTSAELYNPNTGMWANTLPMTYPRQQHTATLLPSGLVLVAGGDDGSGNAITNAELYNPATGTWLVTAGMNQAREGHTATLLPNGEVLVTGGSTNGIGNNSPGGVPPSGGSLGSTELYNPATGTWSYTGAMYYPRAYHTATLLPGSLVLVTGGMDINGNAMTNTELYDPTSGTWNIAAGTLNTARYAHAATMLPDGRVLVEGGLDSSGNGINSGETYYPVQYQGDNGNDFWSYTTNTLQTGRGWLTATMLYDGYDCQVVVAGGGSSVATSYNDVDVFDALDNINEWWDSFYSLYPGGLWTATDWMGLARVEHSATLLNNGEVLVTGGADGATFYNTFTNAELYNAATGLWTNTGSMNTPRVAQTATLLTNGQVLVAGGDDVANGFAAVTASAELYNPVTRIWTNTGSMNYARWFATATLLTNGMVLVTGGSPAYAIATADTELYNPVTGIWTNTGSLITPRSLHTATLLKSGQVLVAGGYDNNGDVLASAELYNPVTGAWTNTGSMNSPRQEQTATSLPYGSRGIPSGAVLVAGGYDNNGNVLASAEIYNPATGTWTNTASMNYPRAAFTATWRFNLLPYGTVFVTGGYSSNGEILATAEYFYNGTWLMASPMDADRVYHTATLLPGNELLITGGNSSARPALPFSETYNEGAWW